MLPNSRLWIKRTPWNNRSPPLKNFHIMILTLFYINLGILVIFFLILQKFSLINKRTPIFIPESRVLNQGQASGMDWTLHTDL